MSKSNWTLLIAVVVLIVLAFIGGRLIFYGNGNTTYIPPQRDLTAISVENSPRSARLEAVDNPEVSAGVVLVDFGHRNALFVEELNILFSKIVARGFSYEILLPGEEGSENADNSLIDKLRYAKGLILPLPRSDYTAAEVAAIERFVEKGGRLLIIGDPTRTVFVDALNSIAGSFDMVYAADYLYSLENNDNNYRNVIYTNFQESPLTRGLDNGKIIFYSSGSIHSPGHEIILGDDTTYSSISEGGRTMAAAVLTSDDRVLALGDLTFFNEPYSAAESNGAFINNIADFLSGGSRTYDLQDFPYFFNPNIDIVFDNTLVFNSQFEDSVKLKEFLEQNDHTINYVDEITGANDVIFVGRFDEAEIVADFLSPAQITLIEASEPENNLSEVVNIEEESEGAAENGEKTTPTADIPTDQDQDFVEGRIRIGGVGELERGGSTLFHLDQSNGRNVLIILSDNPDTNAAAFELLLNGEFTQCLVSHTTAVCQTEEPDKRQLPSVRSTRINKILVVSDDDGRKREDKLTGATEFRNVLSDTYVIDIWVTSRDGSPSLGELHEYDAVIWATGDYWDDSIADDDAQLLTEYIDAGGNLLLAGASIAFDWDHTDFLANIVHADYISFAEQKDIEVALPDHAIARNFEEGAVITFVDTPSGEPLLPDVVSHTADARVIFRRGPESKQAGAAAVIAYEDERSKVAYYAFPLYLLPAEEQTLLVNNTINWFTRKPLELPDEDDYEPYVSDGSEEEEQPAGEEEQTEEGDQQQEENQEQNEGNDSGNSGG
jgi:hypothetical protein